MKTKHLVTGLCLMFSMSACSNDLSDFHIIPFPEHISPGSSEFRFTDEVEVFLSEPASEEMLALGAYASEMLHQQLGIVVPVSREPVALDATDAILLRLSGEDEFGGDESYRLIVNPRTITISAPATAGLFYGLQTLRQLPFERVQHSGDSEEHGDEHEESGHDSNDEDHTSQSEVHSESDSEHEAAGDHGTDSDTEVWSTRAVSILDSPRFPYRGLHLDVGRHFFPVDFIKRYIDMMAMYKLNRFHWHLTEDQGWRIEIQKYPRLTEVGAYRRETLLEKNHDPYVGDGIPYGGFYTREEVREIVRYAESRYVTVIPEIEMPGHSQAALAAYPELACTEGPFEVSTRWGVHEDIYCPSEKTFAFLEDVLLEVMDLFPSEYIHIGGDEAPKNRWEESELAQDVIRNEGLADEHELQSYFIRRIETFLNSHGRKLIGWDEILEGGLAPDATVMSWRGIEPGIEAARQGHNVIMTPNSHMYFDYYQADADDEPLAIGGHLPLETVYSFEPIPDSLSWNEGHRILGAQANVWTEYMKTTDYVEYMVFPRALALAEVVWSPRDRRDWEFFVARLSSQFVLLEQMGVNYRPLE